MTLSIALDDKEQFLAQLKDIFKDYSDLNIEQFDAKLLEHISHYEIKAIEGLKNNIDLKEKIDIFISAKRLEGLSGLTIEGYIIELNLFAKYINKPVKDISIADILRHTFATLMLNNDASLKAIQELLGHENPAITQVYATLSEENKQEQHAKYLVQ